jgi:cystathionine beta-lyase
MASFTDETNCIHHPKPSLEGYDSFAIPTYRASTIVFSDAESYRTRVSRIPDGYSYGLAGTPTTRALEANLSLLHGGERSIIVPSGQAAITTFMLTVLNHGDHLLIPDNVYPPVKQFTREILKPLGIRVDIYDPMDIPALQQAVIPGSTKLIWIEAPGSTTMEVCDIPSIVTIAREAGALTGCDNTWATPLLCKPLKLGVDVAAEALTKYVGGHSDLLLGSATFRDFDLYTRVRRQLSNLGVGVSPDDCTLALRGLETMALRLERVGRVAREFAERLSEMLPKNSVLHPALPSSPGYGIWKRDFSGSSGVFTIKLKISSQEKLDKALDNLSCFAIGASWGGTRSLVAPMTLANDRSLQAIDVEAVYLRVSIGLESPADLWEDLNRLVLALS